MAGMTLDGAKDVLNMLSKGTGEPDAQLELRAKVGQLSFAAQQYANRSGCDCDGCCYLREAADAFMPEPKRGKVADAQRPDPPA
jgi:hypothetical protein